LNKNLKFSTILLTLFPDATKFAFQVCTDLECRDPCRERGEHLITCECDLFHASRCELCCFDTQTKRCESAQTKYGIANQDGTPIRRPKLSCRYGPHCGFTGECSGAMMRATLAPLATLTVFLCLTQNRRFL